MEPRSVEDEDIRHDRAGSAGAQRMQGEACPERHGCLSAAPCGPPRARSGIFHCSRWPRCRSTSRGDVRKRHSRGNARINVRGWHGVHEAARGGVEIPAKGIVKFESGGKHVMFFDVNPALQPPRTMPINFIFASGERIQVDAVLIRPGEK
ncbi:copper chaperone PCu(A)C [Sphingomonas paeninsulae]|uniref:Copper chaperone PCu(A)C n=1 Tax=Sphingomonas paeninsulae TaxID=2319844 RepID=A0A494TIM4_SPHPE|nr:copper chaperone PCu(A)C [Sphingomonas paeninsulae]